MRPTPRRLRRLHAAEFSEQSNDTRIETDLSMWLPPAPAVAFKTVRKFIGATVTWLTKRYWSRTTLECRYSRKQDLWLGLCSQGPRQDKELACHGLLRFISLEGNKKTHIGVHPKLNTTMKRYIKVIPAFDLAALPSELSKPETMARMQTITAVELKSALRRPKRSMMKEPCGFINFLPTSDVTVETYCQSCKKWFRFLFRRRKEIIYLPDTKSRCSQSWE